MPPTPVDTVLLREDASFVAVESVDPSHSVAASSLDSCASSIQPVAVDADGAFHLSISKKYLKGAIAITVMEAVFIALAMLPLLGISPYLMHEQQLGIAWAIIMMTGIFACIWLGLAIWLGTTPEADPIEKELALPASNAFGLVLCSVSAKDIVEINESSHFICIAQGYELWTVSIVEKGDSLSQLRVERTWDVERLPLPFWSAEAEAFRLRLRIADRFILNRFFRKLDQSVGEFAGEDHSSQRLQTPVNVTRKSKRRADRIDWMAPLFGLLAIWVVTPLVGFNQICELCAYSRPELAIQLCNARLALSPDDRTLDTRAEAYLRLGKLDLAEADLRSVKNSQSDRLPLILLRRGDFSGALQALDKEESQALNPKYSERYRAHRLGILAADRSYVYAAQGDFELAVHAANKAVKLSPGLSSGYLARGYVYHLTNDDNQALADYSTAIHLYDNAVARQLRARAYEVTGHEAKAVADRVEAKRKSYVRFFPPGFDDSGDPLPMQASVTTPR